MKDDESLASFPHFGQDEVKWNGMVVYSFANVKSALHGVRSVLAALLGAAPVDRPASPCHIRTLGLLQQEPVQHHLCVASLRVHKVDLVVRVGGDDGVLQVLGDKVLVAVKGPAHER